MSIFIKTKNKEKKVIILVIGGLGNQMFCYAWYRYWELKGINVFFDIGNLISGMPPAKFNEPLTLFELVKYFPNLSPNIITTHEYKHDFDFGKHFSLKYLLQQKMYYACIKKILRKIIKLCFKTGKKVTPNTEVIFERTWNREYLINGITNKSNHLIRGFFQMHQYTFEIRDILLKEYAFTNDLPDIVKYFRSEIESNNSISLHVRRGVFMLPYWYYSNGFVGTIQYYKNAVNYIKSCYSDQKFYIFSDDFEWVKSNFGFLENYIIVDTSSEGDFSAYYDLFLMSRCKHNILSNSTFSWWGAFLNQNNEKTVLVPPKYSSENFILTDEVCPPEWIRVPMAEPHYISEDNIYPNQEH